MVSLYTQKKDTNLEGGDADGTESQSYSYHADSATEATKNADLAIKRNGSAESCSSLQLQVQDDVRGALHWNLILATAARTAVLLLGTGLTAVGVHVAVCLQLGIDGIAGDIFMASAHPVLLVAGTALVLGGARDHILLPTTLLSSIRSWCRVGKQAFRQLSKPRDLSLSHHEAHRQHLSSPLSLLPPPPAIAPLFPSADLPLLLPPPKEDRCELGIYTLPDASTAVPLISDADLAKLMWRLGSGPHESGWESIVEKESDSVSYTAWRRDPPGGGPTEYLSTTYYENCPVDLLLRFFLDSHFLAEWDKMVLSYTQMSLCQASGVETGWFVKQYPFCSPREYVLRWRVWEGAEGEYYCCTKAADDDLVPRQRNLCRVESYDAMWRIRKVAGMSSSQVTLFLSENNGMHRDFAKCAFKRGVWGYIRRTDHHLRQYAKTRYLPHSTFHNKTAIDFTTKVPRSLDHNIVNYEEGDCPSDGEVGTESQKMVMSTSRIHKVSSRSNFGADMERYNKARVNRGPRKGGKRGKVLSSLALVGGAMVLARGAMPWGVKVAAMYLLQNVLKLPLLGKE